MADHGQALMSRPQQNVAKFRTEIPVTWIGLNNSIKTTLFFNDRVNQKFTDSHNGHISSFEVSLIVKWHIRKFPQSMS